MTSEQRVDAREAPVPTRARHRREVPVVERVGEDESAPRRLRVEIEGQRPAVPGPHEACRRHRLGHGEGRTVGEPVGLLGRIGDRAPDARDGVAVVAFESQHRTGFEREVTEREVRDHSPAPCRVLTERHRVLLVELGDRDVGLDLVDRVPGEQGVETVEVGLPSGRVLRSGTVPLVEDVRESQGASLGRRAQVERVALVAPLPGESVGWIELGDHHAGPGDVERLAELGRPRDRPHEPRSELGGFADRAPHAVHGVRERALEVQRGSSVDVDQPSVHDAPSRNGLSRPSSVAPHAVVQKPRHRLGAGQPTLVSRTAVTDRELPSSVWSVRGSMRQSKV